MCRCLIVATVRGHEGMRSLYFSAGTPIDTICSAEKTVHISYHNGFVSRELLYGHIY